MASTELKQEVKQVIIRPAYRNNAWIGFSLHTGREPLGKVYASYKLAYRALVTFTGPNA